MCEDKLEKFRISLGKDSSNSCKPSSTNGFKRIVQNNRVKSGKKQGREKGHIPSAPKVSQIPDRIIRVSKVATCTCGCETVEMEDIARDLISVEIITHTTQYIGKKTLCPNCHKEYIPKFPKELKHTVQYDSKVKSMIVYGNRLKIYVQSEKI